MDKKVYLQALVDDDSGVAVKIDKLPSELQEYLKVHQEYVFDSIFYGKSFFYETCVVFFKEVDKVPKGDEKKLFETETHIFIL